jgi:hypothetical protein
MEKKVSNFDSFIVSIVFVCINKNLNTPKKNISGENNLFSQSNTYNLVCSFLRKILKFLSYLCD